MGVDDGLGVAAPVDLAVHQPRAGGHVGELVVLLDAGADDVVGAGHRLVHVVLGDQHVPVIGPHADVAAMELEEVHLHQVARCRLDGVDAGAVLSR